jgi:tRNA G18 (ribose-2'-O)-methylase SpoU
MAPCEITDLDDPRIAIFRSLKATNQTRGMAQFVVEGEKLVERLLASRFPVTSVLATDRYAGRLGAIVPDHVPVFIVPFESIHKIVGFPFHRGVLAAGKRLAWPSLDEIVGAAQKRATFLVCPRLSNPENLGAIARIGDVLGVDGLFVGGRCPDPLSRRVLRVSMGAVLHLPLFASDRLDEAVQRMAQEFNLELWAAVADSSAESFDAIARPERLAIVLGDEDQGVEPDWLSRCCRSITIPMRPGAGSLNVSIAAGILLYHLCGTCPPPPNHPTEETAEPTGE